MYQQNVFICNHPNTTRPALYACIAVRGEKIECKKINVTKTVIGVSDSHVIVGDAVRAIGKTFLAPSDPLGFLLLPTFPQSHYMDCTDIFV
jgi:hypothetical protein